MDLAGVATYAYNYGALKITFLLSSSGFVDGALLDNKLSLPINPIFQLQITNLYPSTMCIDCLIYTYLRAKYLLHGKVVECMTQINVYEKVQLF